MESTVKHRSHSTRNLTKQLNIRLSVDMYILVNELAEYDSIPMASVIKMAIGDYIRKRDFMKRSELLRVRR